MKADFATITEHILNAIFTPAPAEFQETAAESSESTEAPDSHYIAFEFLARVRTLNSYMNSGSDRYDAMSRCCMRIVVAAL